MEENRYNLDNLTKYEKKDLLGKTFVIDYITESYLGDNGFFKICFLKVDSEEVNGFTFISSNSALDKPGVVGKPVTIVEKISKNKYTYYKFSEPELSPEQLTLEDVNKAVKKVLKPKGKSKK